MTQNGNKFANTKVCRASYKFTFESSSFFQVCPINVADHVNLGLIPSSTEGWPTACAALKKNSGGVLHIHSNVTLKQKKNSHLCESGASAGSIVSAVGCENKRAVTNDHVNNIKARTSGSGYDCLEHSKKGSTVNREERHTETINGVVSSSAPGCVKTLNTKSSDNAVVSSEICLDTEKEKLRTFKRISCTTTNDKIETSFVNSVEKNDRSCGKGDLSINKKVELWKEEVMCAQESSDTWTETVSGIIKDIFFSLYSQDWTVSVLHIERVKSYAPHVYHVVLDLECRP